MYKRQVARIAARIAARGVAGGVARAPAPVADVAAAPPPVAALPAAPMPAPAPVAEAPAAAAAKATAEDAMVRERRAAEPARTQSLMSTVVAAAGVITGRVVTPDGRPIAAAQVQVEGTTAGAVTDSAGAFRVVGPARGTATLRARRIGYDMATVAVSRADSASATIVLRSSPLALSQVVTTGAAALAPTAWRGTASAAVGCWSVRPERGWTAAAPALPGVLRLDRVGREIGEGPARVADEAARAAWRDGTWSVVAAESLSVTLPATGGEVELALRRAPRGWRGTATWAATPPSARAVAPTDVRLVSARCPAP